MVGLPVGLVVDSTAIIVAFVASLPSMLGAYLSYRIRRDHRLPSGEPIGKVVERTYDLAAVNNAQLLQHGRELRKLNGGGDGELEPDGGDG